MEDNETAASNIVYMEHASPESNHAMSKQRLMGRLMAFRCEVDADDAENVIAQIRKHNLQAVIMGYHYGRPVTFEIAWQTVYGQ